MKKFAIKLLILVLCLATLISLVACDGTKNPSESDSDKTPTGSDSDTAPESGSDTPENVLEVKWNFGAVGSEDNADHPNAIYTKDYYSYTDVITIPKKGTKIIFTDDNTNSNDDAAYILVKDYLVSAWVKDDNGEWVFDRRGGNVEGSGTANRSYAQYVYDFETGTEKMVYSYITSLDNECIRLCFRSGQTADFTPASFPTVTFEYTDEPGTDLEDITAARFLEQNYFPELEGLTVNLIGDSYISTSTTYTKWPHLLEDKYNLKLTNKGISGSQVSNYGETLNRPMVSRLDTLPDNDPDIVLFQGGRNDVHDQTPIGTNDSMDIKTFKGACNYIITVLKNKYPNALIVTMTAWNVTTTGKQGLSTTDYAIALAEVSEMHGVPCFRSYDEDLSGVHMMDKDFRAKYCNTPSDVSHFNQEGHNYFFPTIEKFFGEEYVKFLASKAK